MGMVVFPGTDEPVASGQRSAPLPDRGDATRPRCPRCGHQRHVHPFRPWPAHGAWVWHCSNTRVRGPGTLDLCGYLWLPKRPLPVCDTCMGRLVMDLRAGELAYWCASCQDISH
jgi:hypothetical protein